jgi:DNA-binding response OmpR family regulator
MSDPRRIVLIDDSDFFLDVLGTELEQAGYQVSSAHDLSELDAIKLDIEQADLILMDVQMPEAYGDDVAAVFRQMRGVSRPILLLSSLPEAELADRAREAEIEGCIPKQIGAKQIVSRVNAYLDSRG